MADLADPDDDLISSLLRRFPRAGRLDWIGVRPGRKEPLVSVAAVDVGKGGLGGDHRNKPGKRAVTLIQAEHLPAIAALSGHDEVAPATLRRNLLVSGIPLLALRNQTFRIGEAVLRGTGLCAPCSFMEKALGPGGYNAVRGHGGICAEVLTEGRIALGDPVEALPGD